ncbi:WD-40 repeat-containing protein [Breoghania corrubedonensis]|uniref:WD-40 repeat-containing protein n=1 Tax=Breoghania corrubedonensis TaxID=665038 RepID=A0A2T5VHT2_9HYPH|nr:WD40 repeat domain-containing protein [Breoghania corrubedonensis]PTW63310.1 WD-40 repeat-containing protein [Breoghania corrubedonensis]
MPTIAPQSFSAFVVSAGFLGDIAYFALGDGAVHLIGPEPKVVQAHKGSVLAASLAREGQSLVTSGDDGRVVRIAADGTLDVLAELPRKWIDILATGPDGAIAFASGRAAWTRDRNGVEKEFAIERAVGGLAFAPKGMRLAMARYGGATLYWVNTAGTPVELTWAGAHNAVIWSPDGKYVVTSMQENALHGWRLSDGQDMRMTGYPTKVKSMSWTARGKYLATSGAAAAILWPFAGKSGPMGQEPLQLGARGEDALVTMVACHPEEEAIAIGYQDGLVLVSRFQDGAERVLRRPGEGAISALSWSAEGMKLAFGTEEGAGGVIALP